MHRAGATKKIAGACPLQMPQHARTIQSASHASGETGARGRRKSNAIILQTSRAARPLRAATGANARQWTAAAKQPQPHARQPRARITAHANGIRNTAIAMKAIAQISQILVAATPASEAHAHGAAAIAQTSGALTSATRMRQPASTILQTLAAAGMGYSATKKDAITITMKTIATAIHHAHGSHQAAAGARKQAAGIMTTCHFPEMQMKAHV